MGERKQRWGFLRTLNIIDAVMLCVLAGLGIIGIQSYRLLATPQVPIRWNLDESIEVFCVFPRVDNALAQKIHPGIIEKDPTGRTVIEILEIIPMSTVPLMAQLSPSFQVPTRTSLPFTKVIARLRLYGDVREDGRFYCKGQPVIVGSPIEVMISQLVIRGTVKFGPTKTIHISLGARNILPAVIQLLTPGDWLYDNKGEISGKVISAEVISNAWTPQAKAYTLPLDAHKNEAIRSAMSSSQTLINLWAQLRCEANSSSMFFDGEPIMIGKEILLRSNQYSFKAEVAEVYEVSSKGLPR